MPVGDAAQIEFADLPAGRAHVDHAEGAGGERRLEGREELGLPRLSRPDVPEVDDPAGPDGNARSGRFIHGPTFGALFGFPLSALVSGW